MKNLWVGLIVVALIAIGGWFTPAGKAVFGALADSSNYTNLGAKVLKVGLGCDDSSTWNACVGFAIDSSGAITTAGQTATTSVSAMTAATTTPCALLSPNSTSTLERAAFNVTTATSSAGLVTIATSTNAFATTSLGTAGTIGANAQGTIVYHPPVLISSPLAPNTYVVFGLSGVNYGYTYGGTCSASFLTI